MCQFCCDEKSWKIFVILFGGIKKSPYLCRRFSGARQFENKLSLRSLAKSLHRQLRPTEQFHRGPATGHSYDRGEGQTTIGAGPKLPSTRSLFSSKTLAPERAKKEKARRVKERAKRELKPNFPPKKVHIKSV